MTKMNRIPQPDSPIFAMRGDKVKWPTLRGAYLDDAKVAQIKSFAFGVIFLDGKYNTRLNFSKDSEERAIFFEHLHNIGGGHIFLLCWIGNFHNGSIFHCAWQFPQYKAWKDTTLEWAAFRTYKKVAEIMYGPEGISDIEVKTFIEAKR